MEKRRCGGAHQETRQQRQHHQREQQPEEVEVQVHARGGDLAADQASMTWRREQAQEVRRAAEDHRPDGGSPWTTSWRRHRWFHGLQCKKVTTSLA